MVAKRRIKRFVRDASRFSLFSLSLPPSFLSLFPLHSPFSPASSVFSVPLCYPPLQAKIYKRERVFQGRANGSSSNGNNLEDKDAPARRSCSEDAQ